MIDTSAPYASGIRAALPGARIAVDNWHLVALANQMLTEVRQRVTRERYGRRGTTAEKVWVNRQLLLTGYEHLSAKQRARLKSTLAAEDPTGEIGAAWGVKERLRMLLGETDEHRIRHRLYQFYRDAGRADMPETTRLATTIETWWPAIHVALTMEVTNARTEGFNRIIKNTKRVSPAASATSRTTSAGYSQASRSPEHDETQHDHGPAPRKVGEPLKRLYLVTRGMHPKGTDQARWTMRWKPALNAFAITFADRMPAAENL